MEKGKTSTSTPAGRKDRGILLFWRGSRRSAPLVQQVHGRGRCRWARRYLASLLESLHESTILLPPTLSVAVLVWVGGSDVSVGQTSPPVQLTRTLPPRRPARCPLPLRMHTTPSLHHARSPPLLHTHLFPSTALLLSSHVRTFDSAEK
jgi:hypothetical protein